MKRLKLAPAAATVLVLAAVVAAERSRTAGPGQTQAADATTRQPANEGMGMDRYFPNTEKLAPDEMRVIACGTGMPTPRRSQASTCFLVELGNGEKFLFDIGSGAATNIGSLEIPFDALDKIFVSHLHTDHVGDLSALWTGGWVGGRHGPLQVWGPSGQTPELGTRHFVETLRRAFEWDYRGRMGVIPTSGGELVVHEFDYRQENAIVYEKNGVTIRSWPAIHALDGPVSYALEWNGLKFVFGGDTVPNTWFTRYARNADLAIHECFPTPPQLMRKQRLSAQSALNVATSVHTVPAAFGLVMAEINPRMAVAYHFFNDFDIRFPMYEGIRRTYKGPLTMATDLLVWNVSKREVRVRQVVINPDAWPAPPLSPPGQPDARLRTPFSPFVDGGRIDVSRQLAPMIQEFKKQNGLK